MSIRRLFLVPLLLSVVCPLFVLAQIPSAEVEYEADKPEPTLVFSEIWAYLMYNEEAFLLPDSPITDIAYFSARLSVKGELYGSPPVDRLSKHPARKHLVLAEVSNQALTHFVLAPEFGLRDKLVADLAAAATAYQGVVVDLELVPSYDAENFITFMRLLKSAIGKRMLSVCVPARVKRIADAYEYTAIAAIADRVFVMAYDEHWSTSGPGPVASLAWSERIAAYALANVPGSKLILGMPFYGRCWGDSNAASAYKHSSTLKLLAEKGAVIGRDEEGIPYAQFSVQVNYILHYDDAFSTRRRGEIYRRAGVIMVGFWRLGQEDADIWKMLRIGPLNLITGGAS